MKTPKLIFVYNAESGAINALLDTGKKYITPSKYDCALCMVTYGAFGMKKDWKKFVHSLPYSVEFLHRDEFVKKYPNVTIHPPSLVLSNQQQIEVLDKNDFESVKSLEELKSKVTQVVSTLKDQLERS